MIALPKSKVLNIGISNFSPSQLKDLITKTGVKPFAHQMELHPYLQQSAWVSAHQALGISVTAYSPLANSNPVYDPSSREDRSIPPPLLKNDVVIQIAENRNCTAAQVALAWGIGRGTSVIPKSSHAEYIREDYEALDCELGVTDFAKLKVLGTEFLHRFNNPSRQWGVDFFEGLEGV
jgi:diketogulonate reductase-like aldo/keto reductase